MQSPVQISRKKLLRSSTGTVIATLHQQDAVLVQEVMRNDTLRVYASADVYGVELGGALKNIYAIVCGLAAGLEVGQNTIGLLVTRALAEMSRFAVSMGGNPFTFLGLAGVGDLMVTCTSPLSRNHQLGTCVAKGMSLDEASESLGKLAEGVNTLQLVYAKSRELGVYMPLVDGLYQILFEQKDVPDVVSTLMGKTKVQMLSLRIRPVGSKRRGSNRGELIEAVYQRFDDATLSYGHGTDNPWDEAVHLVLSVTGYDDDEVSLGLCVTSDQRERIKALAGRRVDERSPLAHLLGECQFMGQRFC